MLKVVNLLRNWPFNDIIIAAGAFYILYMSRDRIRVNTMRGQAYYQSLCARWEDGEKEVSEAKHMMFKEVFSLLEKNWKLSQDEGDEDVNTDLNDSQFNPANLSVLEIGISCGTNFKYYPKSIHF
jgi:hypothetical protein